MKQTKHPPVRSAASASSAAAMLAAVALAAALVAVAAMASCSTAPKNRDVFDTRNQAADFVKMADGFYEKARWAEAAKYYEQALEADSSVDYVEGVARCHVSLGRNWLAAGDADQAKREFSDGLEYARIAGSKPAQALAIAGLGEVAWAKGDKYSALSRFEDAVAIAQDDNAALAVALHDRATAEAALGRPADAKADLEQAAAFNEKGLRWSEVGANRYMLASVLSREGSYDAALQQAFLALAADKKVENGPGIAQDLAAVASIYGRMQDKQDSWDWWRRAFDTALAVDNPKAVRKALTSLIDLAGQLGKDEDAGRYAALLKRLDEAEAAQAPTAVPPVDGPAAPASAVPAVPSADGQAAPSANGQAAPTANGPAAPSANGQGQPVPGAETGK
jgi:tetratricopeptide (TPR) repeat protein